MNKDVIDLEAKNKEERLFTTRPRYTPEGYVDLNSAGFEYTHTDHSNRGTPASIQLLTDDGGKRALSSSAYSSPEIYSTIKSTVKDLISPDKGFTNFILTDIQSQFNEKVQVSEMFGDAEVVYYFGKSPVTFTLSGMLIDSIDNNWFVEFLHMYQSVIRGTQLAKNYELVQINLPNMKIIGSITNIMYSQNAARDTDIPFGMTIIAKQIIPISTVIPSAPLSNDAVLIDFDRAKDFTNFASMQSVNGLKSSIDALASRADSLIPSGLKDSLIGAGNSFGTVLGAYTNVPATLLGVRSGLFSPVYGIISSITKVVQATTGDITSILKSFTDPVRSILRDIRTVSTQAMGLVSMVENSVNQIVNEPLNVIKDARTTLINLHNTAGAISRMPETISESINRLFRAGALSSSAPFLRSGSSGNDKTALLSSGKPYSAIKGAYL